MITFKTGDIFTSNADYLVNPTNFQGPMGGGLARAMSLRFPGMETEYCRLCKSPTFAPKIQTLDYFAIWRDDSGQRIICFPTMNLGESARIEYIKTGCEKLAGWIAKMPVETSIAFPKLGCGIGGLDWQEVRDVIVDAFARVDCTVEVWE